jgi:hypothetical protein
VPPIYQPEVAADAIAYAARHPRREFWVGLPTVIAIAGNKFAPGLGDRYLARTGVDSQMTDEPENPTRRHNLWEPVPGDAGAHGRFDARASASSLEVQLMKWRPSLTAVGLVAAGAMLAALRFVRQP